MANVAEIGDNNFEAEVLKSDVPVLVDFWAPWCGPCLNMTPVVEELARDYAGRVKVVKINVDQHREAASKYGVRSIPNFILFKGGTVADRKVGDLPKQELTKAIDKLL